MSDIDFKETNRGFLRGEFKDRNGVSCSLQESSAAGDDESCIWLGCNDIGLMKFVPYTGGWKPVELEMDPNGVMHQANTRMHLTQSMVAELLPALAYFAVNGVLPKFADTATDKGGTE
jgi:hypothetical protein